MHMKSLLLFTVLLGLHFSSFSQTWTPKRSLPASGVESPFSFSIGGMLYVGGGWSSSPIDSFFQYDPSGNTWTAMANIPTPIESSYGFVLNGKGYIACGYNGTLTTNVFMYDPGTNTWTQKNNFPGTARQNHVCFSANGKGYLFAGFIGGSSNTNEMWQYNDTTDIWTQKTSAPGPGRNNPTFLIVNNRIYVGMGGTTNISVEYSDFYLFDPIGNTYTAVDSIPVGRGGAANFTLGNLGYVGLGVSATGTYLNDFYTFDPSTNTWAQIDTFGGGARACVFNEIVNGTPYIGCGRYANGLYKSDNWTYGTKTDVHEMTNIANTTLLCYPTPTSGDFTIDMSGYSIGERRINITDQLGRVVYITTSSQDKVQLSNKLSPGLYVVSIVQGVRHDYARVLVE